MKGPRARHNVCVWFSPIEVVGDERSGDAVSGEPEREPASNPRASGTRLNNGSTEPTQTPSASAEELEEPSPADGDPSNSAKGFAEFSRRRARGDREQSATRNRDEVLGVFLGAAQASGTGECPSPRSSRSGSGTV